MKKSIIHFLLAALLVAGCATQNVTVRDETNGGAALPEGGRRRLIKTVPPEYPAHLRKKNVTGTVIVRLFVKADGSVAKAVATSSPNPELALAAERALSQWCFESTTMNPSKLMVIETPITFF